MLYNYLLTAFRNFRNHKIHTLINIIGLSLGIAASLLNYVYVHHELNYDKFHTNAENIYRVYSHMKFGEFESISTGTMTPLAEALRKQGGNIINATVADSDGPITIKNLTNQTYFDGGEGYIADNAFLDVFDFPLAIGNKETVLTEPYSIVLTESLNKSLFAGRNPVGESVDIVGHEKPFKVTGVVKDVPNKSHIEFNYILSLATRSLENRSHWNEFGMTNYVEIQDGLPKEDAEVVLREVFHSNSGFPEGVFGTDELLFLQPILDIHLKSSHLRGSDDQNSMKVVTGFSLLGSIILLLACINFVNLATARGGERSREVGMRKVLGATRPNLIFQFIGESFIIALFALFIAMLILLLILPVFSELANRDFSFSPFQDLSTILSLIGILFFVGLLSGSVPAFYLSSFKPILVLKGLLKKSVKGRRVRSVLVVIQFIVSISLIISTVTIYSQLRYIQNQELGFDKDQIVTLEVSTDFNKKNISALKNQITSIPGVESVSASSGYPFSSHVNRIVFFPESTHDEEASVTCNTLDVDGDFLETYGIKLVDGRTFDELEGEKGADISIVNQAFVDKYIKDQDPIGYDLFGDGDNIVVGVVENFHCQPLTSPLDALGLFPDADRYRFLSVRIGAGHGFSVMASINDAWDKVIVDEPFDPVFLDDTVNAAYRSESKFAKLISSFTIVALIIASLGLFGLASYTIEARTKEIGVRKILGASVNHLLFLLTREFILPVIIAAAVSFPVAYYYMNKWLENFAYRISIGWEIFLISFVASLMIAFLAIGFHAIKMVQENPVNALRYE